MQKHKYKTIQHNTIHYTKLRDNEVDSTIHRKTMLQHTIPHNTNQYNTMQGNDTQCDSMSYNIVYNTIHYDAIRKAMSYNTLG